MVKMIDSCLKRVSQLHNLNPHTTHSDKGIYIKATRACRKVVVTVVTEIAYISLFCLSICFLATASMHLLLSKLGNNRTKRLALKDWYIAYNSCRHAAFCIFAKPPTFLKLPPWVHPQGEGARVDRPTTLCSGQSQKSTKLNIISHQILLADGPSKYSIHMHSKFIFDQTEQSIYKLQPVNYGVHCVMKRLMIEKLIIRFQCHWATVRDQFPENFI